MLRLFLKILAFRVMNCAVSIATNAPWYASHQSATVHLHSQAMKGTITCYFLSSSLRKSSQFLPPLALEAILD